MDTKLTTKLDTMLNSLDETILRVKKALEETNNLLKEYK
jgi:hypothetical protein